MFRALVFVLFFCLPMASMGQVRINEICASNNGNLTDEFGNRPDWIELYNAGSTAVNLEGYWVTDDPSGADKWYFPSVEVGPFQFLIVHCSGHLGPSVGLHASFKLNADGEHVLLGMGSGAVESHAFPWLGSNQTFGRTIDGGPSWTVFGTGTPAATNTGGTTINDPTLAPPDISPRGGFVSTPFTVTMQHPVTLAQIYYTTDGRTPDAGATVYQGSINLTTSAVVRARALLPNGSWTATSTASYLFEPPSAIPTISLATDPEWLFDPDTGIYMPGPNASPDFPHYGANYWSDTEVPAHLTYIGADNNGPFGQNIGLQTHGGSVSRTRPMRSLRVVSKSKYGANTISFTPYTTKPQLTEHKRFILRNSGSDYLQTMFRDGFLHHRMLKDRLHVDAGAYRPARVFINTQYWGLHNIREKYDRYYLESNYGVNVSQLDLLEEQDQVMEGDFVVFDAMESFVLNTDLSQPWAYDSAQTMFDVLNLHDYFIAQTYVNNLDWPNNNLKYWRERKDGAKWRYIIFDLDVALGGVSWSSVDEDEMHRVFNAIGNANRHVRIFNQFLSNDHFRQRFINRYADLVNTTFSAETLLADVDSLQQLLGPEMERHYPRWGAAVGQWHDALATLRYNIEHRPLAALGHVNTHFTLRGINLLTLGNIPAQGGTIALNTIKVSGGTWWGHYFSGNEIDVTAQPNIGNTFSHWESDHPALDGGRNPTLRFDPERPISLTAVYLPSAQLPIMEVYPCPSTGPLTIHLITALGDRGEVTVTDLAGRTVRTIHSGIIAPGKSTYTTDLSPLAEGVYLISVRGTGMRLAERVVLVRQSEG